MNTLNKYNECIQQYVQSRMERNIIFNSLLIKSAKFIEDKKHEEWLRPPKFNVFHALGCGHREIAHSSFLCYFLNPFDHHNQGSRFLKKFLLLIQDAAISQCKDVSITIPDQYYDWTCQKEQKLPEPLGQCDILLRGPKFILIIENKLYAKDLDGQLSRYWNFIDNHTNIDDRSKVLVYLTPDGRCPSPSSYSSSQSFRGGEGRLLKHLILLSYRRDICKLIQDLISEIKHEGSAISVSEILLQYQLLLGEI